MYAYVALVAFLGFTSGAKVTFPDGRIVGGEATTIEEYPYQISLQYVTSHICGGAILDEETIITAAHCLVYPDEVLRVRAGSTNSNEGGVFINVKKTIPHEDYNDVTINNDIGLVKLATPLIFSDKIQPISIPDKEEEIEGDSDIVVSGWGVTEHGGSVPEKVLRKVNMQTLTHEKCKASYQNVITITEQMICAGVPGGGKDSCQGDSGGPLVGENTLLGIVSFGIECGNPLYPGVYTNVTNLISWINDNRYL